MNADFSQRKDREVKFRLYGLHFHLLIFTITVYVKILTRLATPSCDTIDSAYKVLENCGIPRDALVEQDQSNCQLCYDDYEYYDMNPSSDSEYYED